MGVFDKILGRRKPARRRGRGGASAPDGHSDRLTVQIARREEVAPAPSPPAEALDPWNETSADRTELKPPSGPSPGASLPTGPREPARPLPPRSAPPSHQGDETIVGSTAPSANGVVGVLVGIDGPLKDQVFRVFEGETVLGRTDATENLDDRHISRGSHAVVRHVAGYFSIEPVSEKGTFLNGRKIEATEPLSDRDQIRLGSEGATTFLFRSIE